LFKEILSFFLSLVQIVSGFVIGNLYTTESPVDYGGIPHQVKEIAEPLVLVQNGISNYTIIVGSECSVSEDKAARELQSYFEQISSVKLEIADDLTPAGPYEILVGKTNRENLEGFEVSREELGDEGYTVRVRGKKLQIAGGELRGTLYGAYNFLEEQLGCRWFTPELTVVPKNRSIIIDANLDYTHIPVFEYRDSYWISAFDSDWKPKLKINSANARPISAEFGGAISYAGFCHTMDSLVPESLFEEHPEYFSYREDLGEYTRHQRCLTNEGVFNETVKNLRARIRANPNAQIASVTQNDNQEYCQCENCKASDKFYGGPSGTNIAFVNRVAEALADEFPNVAIDTFAYQYTRKPPVNIVPHPNVIVRLCSIECCFSHPLEVCGHERNEPVNKMFVDVPSSFAEDLEGWSKICDRLYIWDYTTNFNLYLNLFPNFQVLSPNMQFFAKNNVKGVFEQGNYNGGKSGEFGELRAYLLAKLLWDPECDVEYHMDDFLKAYYGKEAAVFIKHFINKISDKAIKTEHLFIFDWHYQGMYFSRREREYLDSLWAKAKQVTTDETMLRNIERSELSWRHHKANLFYNEFSLLNPFRPKENEKLYNDIKKHGITRITEHGNLIENPNFWLRPIEWR